MQGQRAAYRSVAICQDDREYFGIRWQDIDDSELLLQDNYLCFRTRTAPYIFSVLSDCIHRIVSSLNIWVYNYLDDFLICSSSFQSALADQRRMISLLRELGFQIAWHKLEGPATRLTYLGIEIDTIQMRISLPAEKVIKTQTELDFWTNKRWGSKKQLQRLSGRLSHSCKAIKGGKLYMHTIFHLLKLVDQIDCVSLSKEFFQELEWWKKMIWEKNAISYSPKTRLTIIL